MKPVHVQYIGSWNDKAAARGELAFLSVVFPGNAISMVCASETDISIQAVCEVASGQEERILLASRCYRAGFEAGYWMERDETTGELHAPHH